MDRPVGTSRAIEVERVSKIFGAGEDGVTRPRRCQRHDPRERVLHASRAFRLRQDHAAAADRRLRVPEPRARSCSTARTSRRLPPYQAPGQHGVPELRPVPAYDGRREYRLRARDAGPAASPRSTDACRQMLELVQMQELKNRAHQPDLRRPAAARGAGARAGAAAEGAAARRAAVGARLQAAQGDADRAEAAAARDRHHLRLRDARPGRSADHVGPHRGHVDGQDPADRRRRAKSTIARPSASSPISSAKPIFSMAESAGQQQRSGARSRWRRGAVVAASPPPGPTPAGKVTIVVRPEHADARHAISVLHHCAASLENIVYFGTDTHYHVTLPEGRRIHRAPAEPPRRQRRLSSRRSRSASSSPTTAAQILRD